MVKKTTKAKIGLAKKIPKFAFLAGVGAIALKMLRRKIIA